MGLLLMEFVCFLFVKEGDLIVIVVSIISRTGSTSVWWLGWGETSSSLFGMIIFVTTFIIIILSFIITTTTLPLITLPQQLTNPILLIPYFQPPNILTCEFKKLLCLNLLRWHSYLIRLLVYLLVKISLSL